MSIDLAFDAAPGLIGGDLYFSRSAISITPVAGAEALVNGDFSAWTGGYPDGWTLYENPGPPDPQVTQVGAGQGHGGGGSGLCNLYSSATGGRPALFQDRLSLGTWYKISVLIDTILAGQVDVTDSYGVFSARFSTTGTQTLTYQASGHARIALIGGTAPINLTLDNASAKPLSNLDRGFVHDHPYGDFSITFTCVANFQAGIRFNVQDANNFALLCFDRLTGKVALSKCVSGTVTPIGAWTAAYAAGKILTARRHKDGTLDVLYDGATLASGLAATGLNGLQAGPFLTDAANVTISRYTWDARRAT